MNVNTHIDCDLYGVVIPHYVSCFEDFFVLFNIFLMFAVSQLMNVITNPFRNCSNCHKPTKTKIYMGSQIILYQMFEYHFTINDLWICKSPLTPIQYFPKKDDVYKPVT